MPMRKRGRPSHLVGDLVTAAILTAMENDPSRDALSDRQALEHSGIFTRVPTGYTLRRAMQSEYLRDALRSVFSELAKHVFALERWFCIDGTYLKSPYYRPFIKVKNPDGAEIWRRSKSTCLVVARGLLTGVPVSLFVGNDNLSEGTVFRPMLDDMLARGAIIRGGGILADAAYNAPKENYDYVAQHGGKAFLDMDSDYVSSNGKLPHFDEQFELYKRNRAQWDSYYDYRVLIETTNHGIKSIKRVIRAQTEIARESEALALIVGYAITRLPEIRLVHGVALPFVDDAALAFLEHAVAKKRWGPALGQAEIEVERELVRTPEFDRASIRAVRLG